MSFSLPTLRVWLALLLLAGVWIPLHSTQAAADTVRVIIELNEPPAAQVYARTRASGEPSLAATAARVQRAHVEAAQQALIPQIHSLGAQVHTRTRMAYNGIAVEVPASQAAALAQLPGVRAVHPDERVHVDTITSAPAIGAPALWDSSTLGLTGAGISIGIIDSGIDYMHTDLGGFGSGYASNDPAVVEPGGSFPNAKVVGGYDFADDDPDPLDCQGHGTHVAGTAAGSGTNDSDGSTYTGGYDTVPFDLLDIGPGVAPEADLYALRALDCNGSGFSSDIIAAIEWAVDPDENGDITDHLDVINLSLGSDFGTADHPLSEAANTAAEAGVIVVAATGNAGDMYYAVGRPAVADRVLAVGNAFVVETAPDDYLVGISSGSARGPRRGDSVLKPDVVAPGTLIRSARHESGNVGVRYSGTSMAAPHAAGALALLRQLHPDWTVEELKALLMNTANPEIFSAGDPTAPRYGPGRIGAGLIDLERAAASELVAYAADEAGLVSISFGDVPAAAPLTQERQIRVVNHGAAAVEVELAYTAVVDMPGASYSVTPASLNIAAQSSALATVTLSANPEAMQRVGDGTVTDTAANDQRHWLSEESGYIALDPLSPADAPTLHLPVSALPRPVANMQASTDTLAVGETQLTLNGEELIMGSSPPQDTRSLVSVFDLRATDPAIPGNVPSVIKSGDVRYAGFASDYAAAGTLADTTLYFGIVTHSAWSSLHPVEFRVLIDSSGDGEADHQLSTFNPQPPTTRDDSFRVWLSRVNPTGTPTQGGYVNVIPADEYDTSPFHTNVLVLPVSAAALGLTADTTRISYTVETRYDTTAAMVIEDITAPGVYATDGIDGGPLFFDSPGETITLAYGRDGWRSQGVLLLHHHNTAGARAEVVALPVQRQYLPLVQR